MAVSRPSVHVIRAADVLAHRPRLRRSITTDNATSGRRMTKASRHADTLRAASPNRPWRSAAQFGGAPDCDAGSALGSRSATARQCSRDIGRVRNQKALRGRVIVALAGPACRDDIETFEAAAGCTWARFRRSSSPACSIGAPSVCFPTSSTTSLRQ